MRIKNATLTAWYFIKAITILCFWAPIYVFFSLKNNLQTDLVLSCAQYTTENMKELQDAINSTEFDFNGPDDHSAN